MKTLLLNVTYSDETNKFWLDSQVKNLQIIQESNETHHQTIQRVLTELDFVEFSYNGKPQGNIFMDTKSGEVKRVGYSYRVKSNIDNKKAYFTAWVSVSEIIDADIDEIE